MPIIAQSEIQSGKSAAQTLDKFQRKYTTTTQVLATKDLDEWDVINNAGPAVGTSVHPRDTTCICISKSCTLKDLGSASQNCNVWHISATFDSESPLQQIEDPVSREVIVTGNYQQEKLAVTEDLSTPPKAILNSAYEPFADPVEIHVSRERITLQKNYAKSGILALDFAWLAGLADSYNDAEWWNRALGTCKMDGITYAEKIDNLVKYWEVTFTVLVDTRFPFGPTCKILDRGFKELIGPGKSQVILDTQGVPLTKPKLLDGTGTVLGDNDPPVYLDYKLYKPASWSLVPTPL